MRMLIFLSVFIFNTPFTSSLTAQNKQFTGNWTKLETAYNFSFDLYVRHLPGNKVEGYFKWKLVSYDKKHTFSANHYKDKIGITAKEYVRGTYNQNTKRYDLQGYKKDDPHRIIGLDHYILKVDQVGNISGDTSSGGEWKGRINGKALKQQNV